ncbi:MAG: hypothetical protein ACQEWI_10830 [Bacillota bacterium]
MEKYRFAEDLNQKVVDGILNGYKSYVEERNLKLQNMRISDAYAWVKGNHIDDQTAAECASYGTLYKKARAGYTWGYLQFTSPEDNSMFIIKNAKYFNPENVPGGKSVQGKKINKKNDENYLKKLSKINHKVDFPEEFNLFSVMDEDQEMLSIFDDQLLKIIDEDDISNLQIEFEKFYIVTYEIDEAHMISKILLWMPNPQNDTAYLVEDLTDRIDNSSVSFDGLDTAVLENDLVEYDPDTLTATDYNVAVQDVSKEKKTDNQS